MRPRTRPQARIRPAVPMLAGLVSLLLLTTLPPALAAAASFEVTNTQDSGPGSLRAAIEAADGNQGADTIEIETAGTIALSRGLLPLEGTLTIAGPSQDALTVSRATGATTTFSVFSTQPDSDVTIRNLTISGGKSVAGGGIRAFGQLTVVGSLVTGNVAAASEGRVAQVRGGGIYSSGGLTLIETTVIGNAAVAANASGLTEASGGGVAARSGARIIRSTIANNRAEATTSRGNVVALGGGLQIEESPEEVELSTISGNLASAKGGSMSEASGGGIATELNLQLSGSTVVGNGVGGSGVSAANIAGSSPALARDSIIARPLGAPSCAGALASEGFNLDEDGSCRLAQPTDLSHLAPGLAPSLGANGGLTPTFAVLAGSNLIGRGSAFGASSDQRGYARPAGEPAVPGGDGSDIGSYELEGATDTTPPQTRLDVHRTAKPTGYFVFYAEEIGARFQCQLDGGAFKPCTVPYRPRLSPGPHSFAVRAVDRAGNRDRSPARVRFRTPRS